MVTLTFINSKKLGCNEFITYEYLHANAGMHSIELFVSNLKIVSQIERYYPRSQILHVRCNGGQQLVKLTFNA